MARPRPVFPGRIYLITRRCSRRQFLLKPGKRSNQAVLYALAEAAAHTGVKVLWIFTMGNTCYYGIYDPDGSYPLFLRAQTSGPASPSSPPSSKTPSSSSPARTGSSPRAHRCPKR
jgi:hypothetical protein